MMTEGIGQKNRDAERQIEPAEIVAFHNLAPSVAEDDDGQCQPVLRQQRHLADPNIPPPEQLTISPEENAAMVKRLFDAAFPPGTQFGTPLPSAPPVLAPPQRPADHLLLPCLAH